MLPGANFGNASRLTATGTSVITSANAYIIGILFQSTGTGSIQLFAGVTSTATASGLSVTSGAVLSGKIISYVTSTSGTANSALYLPFPAYSSGGITAVMGGSADPSVTLFWCPAGGA